MAFTTVGVYGFFSNISNTNTLNTRIPDKFKHMCNKTCRKKEYTWVSKPNLYENVSLTPILFHFFKIKRRKREKRSNCEQ